MERVCCRSAKPCKTRHSCTFNNNSKPLISAVAILFWVVSAPIAMGQALYVVDDGVSENLVGNSQTGDFIWGNYFSPTSDGLVIDIVEVAFGNAGVKVGDSFQIALYDDLDGDFDPTTNLSLLTTVSETITATGPIGDDRFQSIDIPDTKVSGKFFVAISFNDRFRASSAKIDLSLSNGRSWFAEAAFGDLDIADPFGTASLAGLIDDFGQPGNFLVRAISTQCILGDVNRDNEVNLLDVMPFVDLLVNQEYQCEADVNL